MYKILKYVSVQKGIEMDKHFTFQGHTFDDEKQLRGGSSGVSPLENRLWQYE